MCLSVGKYVPVIAFCCASVSPTLIGLSGVGRSPSPNERVSGAALSTRSKMVPGVSFKLAVSLSNLSNSSDTREVLEDVFLLGYNRHNP